MCRYLSRLGLTPPTAEVEIVYGYILEWFQIILRMLHIITGIAWIGASFYFVWLDNHLRKPLQQALKDKGVDGELWAVHGGGFYNPQKYLVAPKELAENLHWFYWESYWTWMSGFALFVVVYLANAKSMMIDPRVAALTSGQAIEISLAILVGGWLLYDSVCKLFQKNDKLVGLIVVTMVMVVSYLTCHVFAARAAFLITGAMLATCMTANVFFGIIPGQKKVIKSMRAGEPVDPKHGQLAKQRSVHNTYFTLPVLFAMLSGHFHMIYSHNLQWVLLVLLMAASVLIRHYFVLRHKGRNDWWWPALASVIILGVAVTTSPGKAMNVATDSSEAIPHDNSAIAAIIKARCSGCHSAHPTILPITPKNLSYDQWEAVEANAALIYQQVVQTKIMPPGNLTEMTNDERQAVKLWFEARP